jgi:hypothetical protein
VSVGCETGRTIIYQLVFIGARPATPWTLLRVRISAKPEPMKLSGLAPLPWLRQNQLISRLLGLTFPFVKH